MKERAHPFHAKNTRMAMIFLSLLSAVPFVAAFYVANTNEKLETLFSVLFMIFLATIGLIAILRCTISKCPECKTWLQRQKNFHSGDKSEEVKFICKKCNITWNSGIKNEN